MPKKKKAAASTSKPNRFLRAALVVICFLFLIPVVEVALVRFLDPPATVPMILWKFQHSGLTAGGSMPRYEWRKLAQIPVIFLRHCLVSEDQRFFTHRGFDWREIEIARNEAEQKGTAPRGASTITMQCARSVFLWQGRSWIRKGLEAYYTLLMETFLTKKRILELYVNAIELGDGIYGIEAGSQNHFGVSAQHLTREQSAMLAALLPHPKDWNPKRPSPGLSARQQMILKRDNESTFPARLLR